MKPLSLCTMVMWSPVCAHVQLSHVYLMSTLDITHMIVYQALPLLSRESLGMRLVHSKLHVAYRHLGQKLKDKASSSLF